MNKKCLICENTYEPFIHFGKMPIANGFLKQEEFSKEYFFDLSVGFCIHCGMVQLLEQPDREKMFHENYAFFSSTSKSMEAHFAEFANFIQKDYLKSADPFVVEIGSNDGIMLKNFAKRKIRHLGIEPSSNVAQVAIERGVHTISRFFDEEFADEIVKNYGKADAILSANVICHIPYLHSVFGGVKKLLRDDGVFMYEDPYLGDIIEKTSYDQIYDEHEFYFSVGSVSALANMHDLEVTDIFPQETHGGSMRYAITHKGFRKESGTVLRQKEKEKKLGLLEIGTYKKFADNVAKSKEDLMNLLLKLKKEGKRVVGYGATSKSTTIIQYCKITPDLVEFISDTTPIKQGKFSPGGHIPVKPYSEFSKPYPDYALLFAWNHAKEIMEKEQEFVKSGGKWIVYVPEVKII